MQWNRLVVVKLGFDQYNSRYVSHYSLEVRGLVNPNYADLNPLGQLFPESALLYVTDLQMVKVIYKCPLTVQFIS